MAKPLERLTVLNVPAHERAVLVRHMKAKAPADRELRILEAGCGNAWLLDLTGIRYELTGLDVNEDAINNRRLQRRDLQHAILGDLRTVSLEANQYDVIYSSFVLEHVEGAESVLDRFLIWLRPGGILIIRIPDPRSVYGFLSRLTPFWFHVLYKRYIEGRATAGKPGYDPFPTIYDDVVSRAGIHRWCAARGMHLLEEVGWNYPLTRPGPLAHVVAGMSWLLAKLSLGRLTASHINLSFVIEKPTPQAALSQPAPGAEAKATS